MWRLWWLVMFVVVARATSKHIKRKCQNGLRVLTSLLTSIVSVHLPHVKYHLMEGRTNAFVMNLDSTKPSNFVFFRGGNPDLLGHERTKWTILLLFLGRSVTTKWQKVIVCIDYRILLTAQLPLELWIKSGNSFFRILTVINWIIWIGPRCFCLHSASMSFMGVKDGLRTNTPTAAVIIKACEYFGVLPGWY